MALPSDTESLFRKPDPPRSVVAPLPQLTEAERQVLYLRLGSRCRHALEPSPFLKGLYEAFFQADHQDFARLESVFPEQAAAIRRWRTDPMFASVHGAERATSA